MGPIRALLLSSDGEAGLIADMQRILQEHFGCGAGLAVSTVDVGVVRDQRSSQSGLGRAEADVAVLIMSQPRRNELLELVPKIQSQMGGVPLLLAVDCSEAVDIANLLRLGVSDFATAPLSAVDVIPRILRMIEAGNSQARASQLKQKLALHQIVGECPRFATVVAQFPSIASCDASVLVTGETGTGKELCARAIHYLSPRAGRPFVPVNCGAIPPDLVENELFGHEKEAFTGAASTRGGLVQESDGGTLFLDEIDCLPLLAQVKLLRFLQDKEYRPLGSAKPKHADVRIIAASNVDLGEAVSAGRLRRDFYYRLSVVPLVLPPLRERAEDIPLLAAHFLTKYSVRFNKRVTGYTGGAISALMAYEWPGNVRELEHIVERAVVLTQSEQIARSAIQISGRPSTEPGESFQSKKARVVAQFEKDYIQGLLRASGGNITRAAEAASKDRRALRLLIRKHRIDVSEFKTSEAPPAIPHREIR